MNAFLARRTLGLEEFQTEMTFTEVDQWKDISLTYIDTNWLAAFIQFQNDNTIPMNLTIQCYDSSIQTSLCTSVDVFIDNYTTPYTNNGYLKLEHYKEIGSNNTAEFFCQIKSNATGTVLVYLYNWYVIPTDAFSLIFGSTKFCQADYITNANGCLSQTEVDSFCAAKPRETFEGYSEAWSGMIQLNGYIWLIIEKVLQILLYVFLFIILPIYILLWIKKQTERVRR
jgi:hypothetical protein